jgi:hypothetical protein
MANEVVQTVKIGDRRGFAARNGPTHWLKPSASFRRESGDGLLASASDEKSECNRVVAFTIAMLDYTSIVRRSRIRWDFFDFLVDARQQVFVRQVLI